MIPMYNTVKFTDIYSDVTAFIDDYNTVGIPAKLKSDSATTLFYLLYAKYGNNPISNNDINQFKYRLFAIIFQYGPTWEKRLEVQDAIRGLSLDQLREGSKAISNMAMNPDTDPGTGSLTELGYINQQNTNNVKKSVISAYEDLWGLLKVDVTEEFLTKFKQLFKQVVIPEHTYIYATEETD